MRRTVIIHGRKVSERSPRHGRPECELWGVTRANPKFWNGNLLDWTRWVDVHPLVKSGQFEGIPTRRPDAFSWYRSQDGTRPIYLQDPKFAGTPELRREAERLFAQVPGAVPFPIEELLTAFTAGGEPRPHFNCQVGMMMALAKWEGFQTVILNGIGTVATLTHQHLHRDILHWIGYLRGSGMTVIVEGPSTFKPPAQVYAFEAFQYAELAAARREEADPGPDLEALEQLNARELRRGRPPRFRNLGR